MPRRPNADQKRALKAAGWRVCQTHGSGDAGSIAPRRWGRL